MKNVGLLLVVLFMGVMVSACSPVIPSQSEGYNTAANRIGQHHNPYIPAEPYEKGSIDTSVPGVAVLMYHHLLKADENKKFRNNAAVITPEAFAAQMKILHDNGYQTIDLKTLEQYVDRRIKLPRKSVVLTFDDGYLSDFRYASPVLRRYHFKAAMFLVTGLMRKDPEKYDPDILNHVSWAELPKNSDVFTYEAHAHRFHRLLGKKSFMIAQPLAAVKNDIHTVKELTHSVYFAYPYGQYNLNTLNILKEEGFHLAFTTRPGKVYPGSPKFELNRIAIYPYTSQRKFKRIVGIS
ncbi:polysaccharide deacetylase family protein [Aneurinibacillus sp. Ricciae_BoGa-3]|uniref:polysaccharide deacetylase family protein n=1 Tax=Aneurinibacillus sp. Ricciae_BoGa-3 TaxID=3022697 RepID=UPI0023414B23|nr:polysaccharide deacetylase family protein [Aneurinibacillus sp. Ricciae_BoGa-3]WCK54883.1 polysaccharide deacetylase family protein [Aneurinibacillus sp. Ricciae_BoGa-3]